MDRRFLCSDPSRRGLAQAAEPSGTILPPPPPGRSHWSVLHAFLSNFRHTIDIFLWILAMRISWSIYFLFRGRIRCCCFRPDVKVLSEIANQLVPTQGVQLNATQLKAEQKLNRFSVLAWDRERKVGQYDQETRPFARFGRENQCVHLEISRL